MTRSATIFAQWFVALLLCIAVYTGPAAARSVFIMYDTSGSMEDRKFLPAFAASVLASTLDGRPGEDRLFTLTFADFFAANEAIGLEKDNVRILTADNVQQFTEQLPGPIYRLENMSDLALQRRTVEGLNTRFSTVRQGTPYGAIEVTLDAIARETVEGEEVHLIIVSDGEFGEPPTPDEVLQSIRTHGSRIKADVRVSFVLILPASADRKADAENLLANVDKQGIKTALVSVFNGDGVGGFYAVDSGEALWAALQAIIAQIAATDRTELGRYVSYAGSEVKIDTPFSITRIISVATSPDGAPPKLTSVSFPGQAEEIATSMLEADIEFPGLAFQGITSQFRFVPALAPGQHVLTFDGPTESGVFLLFDTNVVAEVDILDSETGAPVPRDAQGVAILEVGNTYQLQTVLSDPGSTQRTDFDALASTTEFTVEIEGDLKRSAIVLEGDTANDRAIGTFVADATGMYSATAQVRIPGFVSPRSSPLQIKVIDPVLVLSLAAERPAEACQTCGANELLSSVTIAEGVIDVASYDIAVAGGVSGTVRIDFAKGLGLFEITDADGKVIAPGSEVQVVPGEFLTLNLRRQPVGADFLAAATGGSFVVTVTPTGASRGDVLEIGRNLSFDVPDATITLVSYAKGSPADGPLELDDKELRTGAVGADLKVDGTLLVPDEHTISVAEAGRSWLWEIRYEVDGYVVNVAPRADLFWLAALEASSWIVGREVEAIVSYRDSLGLQSAEARVSMTFTIGWTTFFRSLALNVLVLLGIYYAASVLLALLRVMRFPPYSVLEEQEYGRERPRRHEMRRSWIWTYPLALLAPFCGPPKERKLIKSLEFQAAMGGAHILLPKGRMPRWIVNGEGLSEQKEQNPKLTKVYVRWGDVLVNENESKDTLTMVRDRRVTA